MKNKSIQIFMACACGAFIGVLVGKQISNSFLSLLIGMLTGGIVGYLTYNVKAIIKAIPEAFRATTEPRFRLSVKVAYLNALDVSAIISGIFGTAIILSTLLVFMIGDGSPEMHLKQKVAVWVAIGIQFIFPLLGFVVGIFENSSKETSLLETEMLKLSRVETLIITKKPITTRNYFLFCNPISVILTIILWLSKEIWGHRKQMIGGLLGIPKGIWKLLIWSIRFAKNLFILVHSDVRTICFVDAAFGAAAGIYFNYNPLLGATIGGILGVLNYYVVSIKILKLKPSH